VDETIMEITGHVNQQMLSRYGHIRAAAKRKCGGTGGGQRTLNQARQQAAATAVVPVSTPVME
jgi:hypothetical protein